MADFTAERQKLADAKAKAGGAADKLANARIELARLERERRAQLRFASQDAIKAIDALIGKQHAGIAGLSDDLAAARATLDGHLDDFAAFTDPRQRIVELSDQTPILLLPLRIETRFKAGAGPAGDGELWVRVYPDDIAVDSFETTLSEAEITRVRAYWVNIWRSGGDQAEDRGAWKVLVGSQGSGRAYWITQNYRPLNQPERPVKPTASPTVILVVPTQQALNDPERSAAFAFWEAIWRAGSSAAAQQAAVDLLVAAVGANSGASLQKSHAPANLDEPLPAGADRASVDVVVRQIVFPADGAVVARAGAWSKAPHVDIMPDRLVLLGYNDQTLTLEQLGRPIPPTLQVGADPSASKTDQTRRDGDEIRFEEDLAWVADFDKAVAMGMGFRVRLAAAAFRRGFDKLMVLGIRLAADASAGQQALETLFDHHHHSRGGLSILPQGRPTNNVEGEGSAYSWREDSDVSFDHYFGPGPAADPVGWFDRSDGRWLATTLGLKPEALSAIPFYGHQDVSDARAMNVALWPATLGYYMDSQLDSVFSDKAVQLTREFFVRHVAARGTIPAIRVGKQPYGILPATPRTRMGWLFPKLRGEVLVQSTPTPELSVMQRVYGLARKVEANWAPLLAEVAFVGKAGSAHQNLLDVVALHPASVEFYQRYAESVQHLYNRAKFNMFGADFWAAIAASALVQEALGLLTDLGWTRGPRDPNPDLLEKLFLDAPNLLKGDLIDDRPLSETDAIRAYAPGGKNYLTWLVEAAGTSHEALRLQQGFSDGVPTALLYMMLRHALDLGFVEVSRQLFLDVGLLSLGEASALRREAKFMHIKEPTAATGIGSRWDHLYRTEMAITGSPKQRIGDYIPTIIKTSVATAYLARQLEALKRIQSRPTAALERLFVEHLDLCSYRLDAWYGGLMSYQLGAMRNSLPGGQGVPKQGLYLGAFGWIENLKSEDKAITPVKLDAEIDQIFNKPGDPPLSRDSTNAGYIHAPSLNQAVTATILRNGYLSNATPGNPGSLAINLSSERVRLALGVIEGMREGQSLAALLGYQFERGLHDRHDAEVDEFIYDLRKAFPLGSDRLSTTKTGATDELGRKLSARDIEARNVIDGLALVEHLRATSNTTYPFGVAGLPTASPAQRNAIGAEAMRIANVADAVADLAMAESVHQIAQGNYERAGATLDSFSKGKFPAVPDVVQTPRSGVTLTHRVGLHLKPGIAAADPANISPRARAEPALNNWLATVLPDASTVACLVTITDDFAGTAVPQVVKQPDLKLAPIDLLYLLDADAGQAMRAIDDAVELHVRSAPGLRPSVRLTIDYRAKIPAVPGHVPFFELAALVRSLRALLLRSRPLRVSDMALANDARNSDDLETTLSIDRATLLRGELDALRAQLDTAQTALQAEIDAASVAAIATAIDSTVQAFAVRMLAVAPFAHPDVGAGSVLDDRRRIFETLHASLRDRIALWDQKLADFDMAILAYEAAPPASDDAKFIALHHAETHILAHPSQRPPALTPEAFRLQLKGTTRGQFDTVLQSLKLLRDTTSALGALYDGMTVAAAAIAPHDVGLLSLDDANTLLLNLATDISGRSAALVSTIAAQVQTADARITDYNAAVRQKEQVDAALAALRALIGEETLIIPQFALPTPQSDEWALAWGAGATANTAILSYLINDKGRTHPVDDWLAGVARVREKLRHFERAGALSEAFGIGALDVQPLQLPYRNEDYWLGLEFPRTLADHTTPFAIDEDKLLYTAHHAVPFSKANPQCGLLLDEWTEVIPARTEDTGLAFHFDRPNSEPPQSLLLALPSNFSGAWTWADLVDTVHETMDLAKKRAIEPTQIDTTPYGRFLPALISPTTVYPITASLNFAFNHGLAGAMLTALGEGQ